MALVVFLRGINVGGHRRFRPSVLARELGRYGLVNVGAAGTFVARTPGSRVAFRAALRRKLPFDAEIAICGGDDVLRLIADDPFSAERLDSDVVRFVSMLSRASRATVTTPIALPEHGKWLVRVLAWRRPFIVGVYRRHMKTIGCLGQLDDLFGAPATTRSWTTMLAVAQVLKSGEA